MTSPFAIKSPAASIVIKTAVLLSFMVMMLHLLEFPHCSYSVSHDSSSSATFEYYAAKKVQFGTALFQNIGPLGYIHYSYDYIGYLHWQKVFLKNISRLVLVLLAGWMMIRLQQPTAKIAWFASLCAYYSFGDGSNRDYLDLQDNLAYLTIYLLALWQLQNRKDRLFRLLSMAGWFFLAFISLNKNTFFILSCFINIAVAMQNLVRRKPLQTVLDAGSFITALVANWLLAGQQLQNLPGFLYGVFAFSSGYNEAMALATPLIPLGLGLLVMLLLAGHILPDWWRNKKEFGRPAIEIFLLFILWKHGFVRSDEHLLIFFYAVLSCAIPIYYYRFESNAQLNLNETGKTGLLTVGSCVAVHLFAIISFYAIIHNCHYKPVRLWNHLQHNTSWLLSPLANTREMERQLQAMKVKHALPNTRRTVGNDSIDFFGYEPGYLLLNDLNYTPRPMPITFVAMNSYLQQANEMFYRNPATAPRFILYQSGGIDNRLFQQDDALARQAMLYSYQPVLRENDLILFQRKQPEDTASVHRARIIREETISFDQAVSLEKLPDQPLWLEATIKHSLAGKIRNLLFKAPPCHIKLRFPDGEEVQVRKFVTAMGECGFLINPYIETIDDLPAAYDPGRATSFGKVAALSFSHNWLDGIFFNNEIKLRWRLAARPTLQ